MTRNEFEELQLNLQQSGMNLKSYLKHIGTNYSTYNYWRKKFQMEEDKHHELAPITFKPESSSAPSFSNLTHTGATLLFPNGLRAHFGSGTERVLLDLLNKSLSGYVLPE